MLKTFILLGGLTALFMVVGYALGGEAGATMALLIAGGMNLFAWWGSDRMVLRMHNAQPVTEAEAPQLYRMTADLAARAGMPMPALYVIHEDQPNAFATGRSPERGAVAVNTGLLDLMNEREVAGVIAHELAHIKHRDTLIMAVTATLAGAIGFLAQFAFMLGRGRENRPNPIAMLLMVILAPMAAALVQMAISRAREFEADAEGARICGDPSWLANGLAKLERGKIGHVNQTAEANPGSAHMFIINPLSGLRMDRLFATHPPTEERIARLMAMGPMGGAPAMVSASRGASPWAAPQSKRNPWA
ncbi:zinc metalloprotease HtpX [Roseococcus sp. SDR]|uniref:zinc metalloprotease HtpX n=1 Tax=Roseococcus sp. SDR TaxID=2835532 RepID=UPI001BCD028A|nr:zinc metalloprotease HtpX [Roseococcus sp. SDR]MBS7790943.1 zinc metalloprotease HtpX [Roseococcus sp. SDR]MBV1846257.1 zinc metalloprotease HtpX [Roseococcus sp. SDR]